MVAFSLLTGCATGLRADIGAPPLTIPSTVDSIRVRIFSAKVSSRLDATGPYQFQQRGGGKLYSAHSGTQVRAMRGTMVIGSQRFKGEVVAMPVNPKDMLKLNGRRYRGALVFHSSGGGRYDIVEYVDLEEYLYGVLTREVDPTWPIESLKAQAIVSRTYALANKGANENERFDVLNGVQDQVYGGMEAEAPASNLAVEQSRGEILVDETGKPVQTFFHSSCGGSTELPQNVWKSANAPDVFGVVTESFCEADPHFKWHLTISYSAIRSKLRRVGIRVSTIKGISIGKKSEGGRAEVFTLQTSGGNVDVWGNRFRLALGPETLRSTLIVNMKAGKSSVWFDGRGWGHGVGLCQWGARGRALVGQTYKQILEAYYPRAKLAKV